MAEISVDIFDLVLDQTKTYAIELDAIKKTKSAKRGSKIYIAFDQSKHKILYVGETVQPIQRRLYQGKKSALSNKKGAYGHYFFSKNFTKLKLISICINISNSPDKEAEKDYESVREYIEGELVFRVRKDYDNWPEEQREIHFLNHDKIGTHREKAKEIYKEIISELIGHKLIKTQ